MKILLISNMYPSQKDQTYGTFVKCFQDGLKQYDKSIKFRTVVIKGRTNSVLIKIYKYTIFYVRILLYILFTKYDLVYVHQITHASPVLLLLRTFKKFKLVMNIHGEDLLIKTHISAFLFHFSALLLKKTNLIVVPSSYFKRILLEKEPDIANDKVFVSPSGGINNKTFQFTETHNLSHKIIYISRIDRGKGWDTLLYALKNLKETNNQQIICYIAGKGFQIEQMQTLIEKLNLGDSCIYIGALSHNEMNDYYKQVDCLIFPTQLEESLGLVGLEALSCGCPVIGSNIGCLPEYIKHNENGFLFTPGNAIELTNCIKKLYSLSPDEYIQLRLNAYQISRLYSSSNVAQAMHEQLEKIILSN
ncbi:glycosyltransferase family 4 protein [Bacteroides mediterraneensis]|uniref:Glycosyltransferase family 4 protein n=1 Tax=Bacteroides mediterraneensis TaxID=1841856 RepID=A0ABS2EWY9_9BACE|nr:glycosyltransferase family 4 protein [Bacteroides mediterraneensis]MBM6759071.1 glycosyltransferase family 4 protein [Bacteroides mediterraneensis]